ncbi:ADP-ribosylglycohydrolase family protein [Hymenobacter sp. BT664]|uniref:ADP-ribosylglycohydrolase family protein n=1 Tax=Hymenobacter montanus TaxID=2771359 RepID=A0A927BCJ0_9BACT|nr:ADP-ribosylglycohydrolase family protein [Hymenobacter montanus]MBD2767567.1 ADP-ribosylglycohydrolase family protein [Hymenobacter montanus]
MDIPTACRSILLGHAVADALGVPVEFEDRAARRADPVVGVRGHGTFDQPPGTFSDDFSLTAILCESFVKSGPDTVDTTDLSKRFINWLTHDYWAANKVFDVGIATRESIQRLASGCPPAQAGGGGEYDNGNGGLMRILPVVVHPLWRKGNAVQRQQLVAQVAGITHRHPRSTLACYIYLLVADGIVSGLTPDKAYSTACKAVLSFLDERLAKELPHFARILSGNIHALPEAEIASDGYVVHTLEAALWVLLNQHTYADTVLAAVNLGFDTDTTAAVAGGIAALAYGGDKSIPEDWLAVLARRSDIEDLAHRLASRMSAEAEG